MSALIKKVVFPAFPEIPSIPEIVDNLLSDDAIKTLSAKQGKALKTLIDDVKNGASFNAEGFKLPTFMGGYIFKFGTKDGSTANGANLSFVVPFPTECLIVLPLPDGDYDNSYAEIANIKNITKSGFDWIGSLVGAGSLNVTGRWLAIGR